MPAYGKVKVDTITYDLSGTATDVSVANIATKASPTFTGTVTVPTPTAGDNSTKAASTAFVVASFATKASPAFTGTATGVNLTLSGDLTVNGTTTTIDTTTLQVEDKNIEIGKVSSPSDTTADGGGWTLKGATDKTFNWVNATDAWTTSEHIHFGDSERAIFGTDQDLVVKHDGSHAYIQNTTGTLYIQDDAYVILSSVTGAETYFKAVKDGNVELFFNNNLKFETLTNGAKVSGNLYVESAGTFLKSNQLTFYPSGTAFLDHAVTGQSLSVRVSNSSSLDTTALTIASTGNATFAGTVSDSKGDLRKIIQNTQGSGYTLVAADAGKHILASGNITIPNSIFSAGDGVVIVNNTSGDLTITSGITNLYLGTDGSTGNKTLASRCTCTVLFTSGTAGYISGGGLS